MDEPERHCREEVLTPAEETFKEYLEQRSRGTASDFEAFGQDHPELAPSLRRRHQQYQLRRSDGERLRQRFPWLVGIWFVFTDLGVLLFACVVGYWIGTDSPAPP